MQMRRPKQTPLAQRTISLALQGGASLGAYTWGVLDALLEDGRLEIEGVTGASAGAINAAALGVGYAAAGRPGAREQLRTFWEELGYAAQSRPRRRFDLLRTVLRFLPRLRSREAFYALSAQLLTDFGMDPETMEPLRGALARTLDLAQLARSGCIKVFVNVTDVETGEPEVFTNGEISVDAICASCALPFLFPPVRVGSRWYWDGGLLGNPAIYPVIYGCETQDVVLVETRPPGPLALPRSGADVMIRSVDLASSAGLVRELRTIKFVTQLLHDAPQPGMREIRLHRIAANQGIAKLDTGSAFKVDVAHFRALRDLGRETGQQWLSHALPETS
jgi:NTE family protein